MADLLHGLYTFIWFSKSMEKCMLLLTKVSANQLAVLHLTISLMGLLIATGGGVRVRFG